jgi:hypothetical protein
MDPMPETESDADLTAATPDAEAAATPFHDLAAYVALRRQGAVALSRNCQARE